MVAKQQFRAVVPPHATATSDGILLEPKQTLDDVIEKVNEVAPTFTLLAKKCSTETEFDAKTVNTYSFGFAVPHLVRTDTTTVADDPRGMLVEMFRTGVSFKNVSNQPVTIHANIPIAKQHIPGMIYTRLSGFRKSKGNKLQDDITLQPGGTGTFKVNLKYLANEYIPMEQIKDNRVWINMMVFAVIIKNVNQETGLPYSEDASILEARPKALYTKRKSNPIIAPTDTLAKQSEENFVLQGMDGYTDLYAVEPVSVEGSQYSALKNEFGSPAAAVPVFTGECNLSWIQEAFAEGDLLGAQKCMVSREVDGRTQSYYTLGLITKRVGGNLRPLDLRSRQGIGTRLIIPGFNVNASPGGDSVFYSNWKWDQNSGHWVLWDDYEQMARYADDRFNDFTPVSTAMPMLFLDGVYTREQREEMMAATLLKGANEFGQPYGKPKGFGEFLRKAISVIEVVAKVAGAIGAVL